MHACVSLLCYVFGVVCLLVGLFVSRIMLILRDRAFGPSGFVCVCVTYSYNVNGIEQVTFGLI